MATAAPQARSRQQASPSGTAVSLPPAQFDAKLSIGGNAVKAKEIDTRLTVDTLVNGHGPYRFLVDSGADSSVVGLHVARALQLPIGSPIIVNHMTGRNLVDRVKVARLSFGLSSTADLEIPALKEEDLGAQGILGIDALAQQRLLLDFDKRQIRVEDGRVKPEHLPGAIIIRARRQRGQLILARVRTGGVALDAVVDTGSEITVGNTALRDKLLRKGRTEFVTAQVTGVTGTTQDVQVAVVPELQLGPVRLQNVPIAFADLPPFAVFALADRPGLLLGTDILEKFKVVSLDFKARKVRFQLRRCGGQNVMMSQASRNDLATHISWAGDPANCAD